MPEGGGMAYRVPTRKKKVKRTPIRHAPRTVSPEGVTAPKPPTRAEVKRGAKKQAGRTYGTTRTQARKTLRRAEYAPPTPKQVKQGAKRQAGRTYGKTRQQARRRLRGREVSGVAALEAAEALERLTRKTRPDARDVLEDVFKPSTTLKDILDAAERSQKYDRPKLVENFPDIGRQTYDPIGAKLGRKKKDKDTKILGFNVEAELEGRGGLAKLGELYKTKILKDSEGESLAAGFSPGQLSVAREGADIATQAIPSTYLTAAGILEATNGDPKRIRKLWKDYKKTSAISAAVSGNFEEALKRAGKRPLTTGLELSGAKAAVGRGAGAVARSGVAGAKAKKAASTERPNLHLYPKELKGPQQERHYSKDLFNKALQVAGEKAKRKAGRDPDVAMPRPSVFLNRPPVRQKVLRKVDTRIHGQEGIRRARREKAAKETVELIPPDEFPAAVRRKVRRKGSKPIRREESPLAHLIAEGTVLLPKTMRADLKKRLAHLKKVEPQAVARGNAWGRANLREQEQIKKLLDDPELDPDKVFAAAFEYVKRQGKVQKRLQDLGQYTTKTEDAKLMTVGQAHMGAQPGKGRSRLVVPGQVFDRAASLKSLQRARKRQSKAAVKQAEDASRRRLEETPEFSTEGRAGTRPLEMQEIKDFLKAQGRDPSTIALISQRPVSTRSVMYLPTDRGGKVTAPAGKGRGGDAYDLGGRELGGEPMLRQAVYAEGQATVAENFGQLVNEFAVHPRKNRQFETSYDRALKVGKEMVEDADENLKPGHVDLVPVNIAHIRAAGEALDKIRERTRAAEPDEAVMEGMAEQVKAAFQRPPDGKGQFVLMPADVAKRIQDHMFTLTTGGQAWQRLTNLWKDIVLTTSSPVTWLMSNVVDLGIRSVFVGSNPVSVVRGRKIVKATGKTNQRRGEEVAESLTGASLFGSAERANIHRPTQVGKTKAGRAATKPFREFRDNVYRLEHTIEKAAQYGALGKAAKRDMKAQAGSLKEMLRLTEEQITEYADTLAVNPAREAKLQKAVEDVVGRWGKVSPSMRRLLGVAPFVQWLGAALRWTYVTLPVHHPIKTALLAAMYEMTDEERRKLGLTLMGDPEDRVQGYQQGSIPIKTWTDEKGRKHVEGIRTGNIGSTGTAGAFPFNVTGFAAPQIRSPLMALMGIGWDGRELTYPDGHPKEGRPLSNEDKLNVTLGMLAEGVTPFGGAFRRAVLEGGRPSHPTSTILAPVTRKKWDKDKKRYVEQAGGAAAGVLDFLNPVGKGQLLTEKTLHEIEKSKQRGQVFEELRNAPKKSEYEKWQDSAGSSEADAYKKWKDSKGSELQKYREWQKTR